MRFTKFIPPIFPLCGDTPFCAFGNEIEDFYFTRKKLVAVTDCVYVFIQLLNTEIVSVTPGAVRSGAIYDAPKIYNTTNNAMPI